MYYYSNKSSARRELKILSKLYNVSHFHTNVKIRSLSRSDELKLSLTATTTTDSSSGLASSSSSSSTSSMYASRMISLDRLQLSGPACKTIIDNRLLFLAYNDISYHHYSLLLDTLYEWPIDIIDILLSYLYSKYNNYWNNDNKALTSKIKLRKQMKIDYQHHLIRRGIIKDEDADEKDRC